MQRFSVCEACGTVEPPAGPKYKVCGQCRAVRYCSRECQAHDWTASHQKKCGRQFYDAGLFAHWLKGVANVAKPQPDSDLILSMFFGHLQDMKFDMDKAMTTTARELVCPCLLARPQYKNMVNVTLDYANDKFLHCCNDTCVFRKAGWARPLLCASKADVSCTLSRGHKHVIAQWFCCSHCEARGMAAHFL